MLLTIDSSIIVVSVLEEEKHHLQCKELMGKISDPKYSVVVPYSVLVEVIASVKRRSNSKELAERLGDDLRNMDTINFLELTEARALQAADIARETCLRGMDAIIVQAAVENGAILISLDNDMLKKSERIARTMNIEELSKF